MSNLPDDWGAYHRVCSTCGQSYHMSGTEECACEPCKIPECWSVAVTPDGYCSACKCHEPCSTCGQLQHPMDMLEVSGGSLRCSDCVETDELGESRDYQRTNNVMDTMSESMNPVGVE